jgi:hydroxyethylthiazole kinase-like sugar kinase family protein
MGGAQNWVLCREWAGIRWRCVVLGVVRGPADMVDVGRVLVAWNGVGEVLEGVVGVGVVPEGVVGHFVEMRKSA